MTGSIQPNWKKLRDIIRSLLDSPNRSLRSIANEAGINPSIISKFLNGKTTLETGTTLKLYTIICRTMPLAKRQDFLNIAGLILLPTEPVPDNDSLIITDSNILSSLSVEPYALGTQLMAAGMKFDYKMNLWEKAVHCFCAAEKQFTGVSKNMAAIAACMTAQQYVNLGDYSKAQEELARIQSSYLTMDSEASYEWHRIKGRLVSLCADFTESIKCFKKCLEISGQPGLEYLAAFAHHSLGRTYREIGIVCFHQNQENDFLYQAQSHLEKSFSIHKKYKHEWWMAFDLFREAQLFQIQGKGQEAQKLRKKARTLLGKEDRAVLHIDLEEARIAVENGEIRAAPALKAEHVLSRWGEVSYPKGMADALQVLGETASVQSDHRQALELYVAALCIYPFESHLGNIKLWEEIERHRKYILKETNGRKSYERLTDRINELIEGRAGYFSFLTKVAADRSRDIAAILEKLRGNN